jgi:glucose-1-phosphate thymidylyltransferase
LVAFDDNYCALSIEENPVNQKLNLTVTILYFGNVQVMEFARQIKFSLRDQL